MRYWSPQHSQNQVIKAQCSYHSFIIQTQSDLIFQKIMEGETYMTYKFTIKWDKKRNSTISSIYSVAFNQKSTQIRFELKRSYFWSASKETLMLSYIFSLSAWACLKQIGHWRSRLNQWHKLIISQDKEKQHFIAMYNMQWYTDTVFPPWW